MPRLHVASSARLAIVGGVLVILFAAGAAALAFGSQGPPVQQRVYQLDVVGDRMSPSQIQANSGDTLTISVQADRAEEIHLHGYDKHFFTSPGQLVTLTFPADRTGAFVIEIEATGTAVGRLDVQPRGGLLGLGHLGDQSSTTVHHRSSETLIQVGSDSLYNLSVEIGAMQPMFTQDQVASHRPKTGEVMFKGQMVMPPGVDPTMAGMGSMPGMGDMPGMKVPPGWHHLEVHVYDKKTGEVVKTLTPTITVTNKSTGQVQQVPIVTMQGVAEGPADFHYGNSVDLPAGLYTVEVTIGRETTDFVFKV